ncbi:hypothetical protein [Kingella potus]|uniref:hypothetical protein n=1 Tax=Kingella potus TaxID=265175 RepID=UPI001FD45F7E|nr:hypothetical protein [Kingella potus]UOP00183.1 hypothetical protein LVJ84_09605 [Kingella potus]
MTEPENRPSENAPLPENGGQNADTDNGETRKAVERKAKGKIRTIRIWLWITASLFAATFFLSQCAMSKPKAKAAIVESCIKNVPFAPKWQQDLQNMGLTDDKGTLVAGYCVCMWEKPLDKLSQKQLDKFSSLTPQEQLALLGGAKAFEQRDKQCLAGLKGG